MKNKLIQNKKGNAAVIITSILTVIVGFGLLVIGNYLYFSIAASADAGTLTVHPGRAATGTLTFNGGYVGCGERVNITSSNGTLVRFIFNTSIDCPQGIPSDSTNITLVGLGSNTSNFAAPNLTYTINANNTLASELTAANATNQTVVTFDTVGTTGNTVITAETLANGSWTGTTLINGANPLTGQATQTSINNYVVIALPLMGLALMILGFSVLFITLRGSFGSGEENR